MHQFAKLAFIAIFVLAWGASDQSLFAQDFRDDDVWIALDEDEKREIEPVLVRLYEEVMPAPALDPSKAFDEARNQLRRRIEELAPSENNQFEKDLSLSLSSYLAAAGDVDESTDRLNAILARLKKTVQQSGAIRPKLERYANLADGIEAFLILAPHEEDTQEDYKKLLVKLKDALIDHVSAPGSPDFRKELGRIVGVLEAIGQSLHVGTANTLVADIRDLYRQPNLSLQVSEELINEFVDATVNPIADSEAVNDCILGTSICGTAETCAKASVCLCDSPDRAELKVLLNGETIANTVGYRKPVQIKSTSRSKFWAEKCLAISDEEFVTGNASASACTNTTIYSIKKVGRKLLSRLIERIAWRRARRQKPQAEAIASCKLERRVESKLDQRIGGGRQFYKEQYRPLLRLLGAAELKLSSNTDELSIGAVFAMQNQLAAARNTPSPRPPEGVDYDLSVSIHESFLKKMLDDEVPPEALTRLVEELLSNLPGGEDRVPTDASELFEQIFEAIKAAEDGSRLDLSSLSALSFKKLPRLRFSGSISGDRWIVLHWSLQEF